MVKGELWTESLGFAYPRWSGVIADATPGRFTQTSGR